MKKRMLAVFAFSSMMMTSCGGLWINKKQVSQEEFNTQVENVDTNHTYKEATLDAFYRVSQTGTKNIDEKATLHFTFDGSKFVTEDKPTDNTSIFLDVINTTSITSFTSELSNIVPSSIPQDNNTTQKYYYDRSGFGYLISGRSKSSSMQTYSLEAEVSVAIEFNTHGLLSRFETKMNVNTKYNGQTNRSDLDFGCTVSYK